MRKLSLLVAILFVMATMGIGYAASVTPGNHTSPGIGDIQGQGKFPSDPHRVFRLVRYATNGGGSIEPGLNSGDVVKWSLVSDDGVTVSATTASFDSAICGVLVTNLATPEYGTQGQTAEEDIGRRNWGFMQTYGWCIVDTASDATITQGEAISSSIEPGKAGAYVPQYQVTAAGGGGPTGFVSNDASVYGQAGVALESATAGSGIKVMLMLN